MIERRPDGSAHQLRYFLVVGTAEGSVETFPVEETPITVGRSTTATICVAEIGVSRHHCVITANGGRLTVLDHGSTNGTLVNGAKVSQARLSHGDVVTVGETRIRVQAQTAGDLLATSAERHRGSNDRGRPMLPHEQLGLIQRLVAEVALCAGYKPAAKAVASALYQAYPVQRAFVLFRTDDDGGVEVAGSRLARGADPDLGDAGRGVVSRVLASGQVQRHLSPSGSTLPGTERPVSVARRASVCAPLRQGEAVNGALLVDAELLPPWMGARESLALLACIADVAALGVGRMSHLERLERLQTPTLQEALAGTVNDRLDESARVRAEVIEEQRIELAARLDELEHLQRSRATLARGLVHDIRNLVGTLDANLTFVRDSLHPESEEAEAMGDAAESSSRIVAMAEDVLAVSRMEEGSFPLSTDDHAPSELVGSAVRQHSAAARERGVVLYEGPTEEGVLINVDGDVMGRVLDNLVGNALRYAGRGGRVSVWARLRSSSAELVVSDTGPGVPDDERDRIFSEWYRSDDPSGTNHGIGLYFCQLAVRAHGGSIRIEGGEGDNRFVVSLPSVCEDHDTHPITEDITQDDL